MISLCLYLGGPSVVALSSCTRLTCSAIRSSAFLWKDLASALLGKPLVLTHLEAWRCKKNGHISGANRVLEEEEEEEEESTASSSSSSSSAAVAIEEGEDVEAAEEVKQKEKEESEEVKDDEASFWRRLFTSAWTCEELVYDYGARRSCLADFNAADRRRLLPRARLGPSWPSSAAGGSSASCVICTSRWWTCRPWP